MQERKDVLEKYKWDLSSYIKDEKMLNEEFSYLENNFLKFKNFYGKFDDSNQLLQFFKFDDEYSIRLDRLACYIYHSLDVDKSNSYFLALVSKLDYLSTKISEATAFVYPQLLNLDEGYLLSLIDNKDFSTYRRTIETILRNKPHKLTEHDSELISKMGMFLGGTSNAFNMLTTGEISFDDVTVNGKTYQVNEANYSVLMNNKNREVRQLALKSLMTGYGDKNKTITSMYLNDIHEDIFFAKLHNFTSVLDEALFDEEVDKAVYERLIKEVNNNLPILHEIMEEKRKALGLDKMAYYDVMVSFEEDKKYSIDEAVEMVKQATLPLGDEYRKILLEKFSQKCIDYMPNKNKETGAYSSGCYGCPSVILMNFTEDLKSVYTLAHEMGHTMHSELSNRTQPYSTSNYKIFVAEVASTVNEILLYNSLIKNADEKLRKALVFDLFDEFRSTVFRQTMFSEFESWIHEALEKEIPKTYEDLNNYYLELNKKYYGEKVEIPDELKYEWSRIPHFYRPFYVYKYATGFISAVCIVENLLNDKDYYKKYINFLKSGSSKDVISLLQEIDVDLTTADPYNRAFKYLREQLTIIK